MTAKIFIGTPTAGGIVKTGYLGSLVPMVAALERAGIETRFRNVDGADSAMQRDIITHEFLGTDFTHLLFVDSDMLFRPDLAEKLLSFDKAVIGTVYSRRSFDLMRMRDLISAGKSFDDAYTLSHKFHAELYEGKVTIDPNGLCRVSALGTGFLLLRRDCFERTKSAAAVYDLDSLQGSTTTGVRGYFRRIGSLSDDYSFLKRWTDAGGEVWGYADAIIRHIGDYQFGTAFRQHMVARARL